MRMFLSASEFSVFFYSIIAYGTLLDQNLSFVDIVRQCACQLLNSLSMYFYYFIQNIGMYDVCTMVTCLRTN